MLFKTLLSNLSFGELSNLSWAGEGNGVIDEAYHPKIARYANEALLRLYSRFILKENDVLVEMYEHITNYHMLPRFAVCHEPVEEEYLYIKDLPLEPFTGDVIKILAVYNSFGFKLPLNDVEDPRSVFTPQAKVLQVPRPFHGQSLSVLYQAQHEPLDYTKLEQPIEVPDVLREAFTAYIAYKVYSHMNTQESTAKAQEHMAIYEAICQDVIDKDLVSTTISDTNTRFQKRGWK